MQTPTDNVIPFDKKPDYSALAVEKIQNELSEFTGGNKEKAVSSFVASTLTHFCEEQARFAEVIYRTPRTLSDCCAEIMADCGSQISDIDVYRKAVKHYFPNAEIHFKMEIEIGDAPSDDEVMRKPVGKPSATRTKKKEKPETAVKPARPVDSINPAKVPINPVKSLKSAKTQAKKPKQQSEIIQLSLF